MSRLNVGTVSIGVVADASGVGPGLAPVGKELDKAAANASEAERKLDKLTRSFNEIARAAKLARQATDQVGSRGFAGGVAGMRSPRGMFDQVQFKTRYFNDADYAMGKALLEGAKQERKNVQDAETIFADVRRRGQKLLKETGSSYYALAPGRMTREQRAANREASERARVGRQSLLTGEAYRLIEDPAPAPVATEAESRRLYESRYRSAKLLQKQREEKAAADATTTQREADAKADFARRRARVAQSLGRQRSGEQESDLDFARRRSRVAFSLAEQRRAEESAPSRGRQILGDAGGALGGGARFFADKTLGIASGVAGFFKGIVERALGYALGRLIGEVAAGLTGLAETALDTTRRYEEQLVSFGVLTGSQPRGTALVGSLQKLAVETPFKSSELLDQAKLLLSYGVAVDDVRDTLSRLGDVASGTGVTLDRLGLAYGQVIAKGRLQGSELRQFTEAGVGVGDFQSAYNESTGKNVGVGDFLGLMEQGQISAAVVEKAFQKMTSAGGRFFGLMEARAQTVSGRIQALTESIELLTQRVGTSFFKNTGLGQFLDKLGKDIRGLDTGKLDGFFRGLDRTVGPFVGRIGRGAASLFGSPGMPDWKSVDAFLDKLTSKTIPDILDGGKVVLDVFLELTRGALMAADALFRIGGFVYSALPSQEGLGNPAQLAVAGVGGILGGRAIAARLGATSLLGRAVPVVGTGLLAYEAYDYLFGKNTGNDRALPRGAAGIAGVQDALKRQQFGAKFAAGAGSGVLGAFFNQLPEKSRAGITDFAFQADKVLRDPANLDALKVARRLTAMQGDGGVSATGFNVGMSDRFTADEYRRYKEIDRRILKGADPGYKSRDEEVAYLGSLGRRRNVPDNDPLLNPQKQVTVTPKDVLAANDGINRFRDAMKGLGKDFDRLAEAAVPGFRQELDDLKGMLGKPQERPFDDFKRRMETVDLALLKRELNPAEADRARLLAFEELRGKAKAPLGEPPPLLRAGSQEAESAITRAMNAAAQSEKPTLEGILQVLKDAYKVQEQQKTEEAETTKVLREIAKKPAGFNFVGIGFGGGK
jgi:hypothetical protein